MKKSVYLLLLLPLLAGCKGSTDSPVESASQMSLSGSINSLVQTRGDGVIDPSAAGFATTALSLNFARINQDGLTGSYPTVAAGESPYKGSTVLPATRAAGAGSTAITFAAGSEQYYLPGTTNNSSKLVGWYPTTTAVNSPSAFSNGVVTFTIDGSTDIMLSNEVTGSSSALFSAAAQAFTFNHLLPQLQFKVYAIDAATQTTWGSITSIKVLGQATTCTVTLPGTVATSGSADLAVSGVTFPLAIPTGSASAAAVGYSMIAPVPSANSITLRVETTAGGSKDVVIPALAGGFVGGNAYVITLNFSTASGISVNTAIGTWISATGPEKTVS